jgi:hypothetical protein
LSRSVDELLPPFYVVPMPLNEQGHGPETDPAEVVVTTWEVWDCLTLAVCTTSDEAIARLIAQRLNG